MRDGEGGRVYYGVGIRIKHWKPTEERHNTLHISITTQYVCSESIREMLLNSRIHLIAQGQF